MSELPVIDGLIYLKVSSAPNDLGCAIILVGILFILVTVFGFSESFNKKNVKKAVLFGIAFVASVAAIMLACSPLMAEHTYLALSDGLADLVEIQQLFEILKIEGLNFTLKPLF